MRRVSNVLLRGWRGKRGYATGVKEPGVFGDLRAPRLHPSKTFQKSKNLGYFLRKGLLLDLFLLSPLAIFYFSLDSESPSGTLPQLSTVIPYETGKSMIGTWREFKIVSVSNAGAQKRVRLQMWKRHSTVGVPDSSSILIRTPPEKWEQAFVPEMKISTIASSNAQEGWFEVILPSDDSHLSKHHSQLKAGDIIQLKGPVTEQEGSQYK
eukprot:TRINITY_DN8895_c0_g1_i1.p1 TRINITY_DN8895_c0_g1~~TRINITY_DN8895_c0_g1_i1.p1  ORF type:complete len:216 (+),score=39.21 TRINITY_DN8895_c0_g1_i1:22-648(+)